MISLGEGNTYRISIDGSWSLKDFYELPHVFAQTYSFNCAFLIEEEALDPERLLQAFASYPWRGGYSAVNFYNVLANQIPRKLRPKVKSIQYASPGWIELGLFVPAAIEIGKVIGIFVVSAGSLHSLYSQIHRGLHDRKLLRIDEKRKDLELSREELDFSIESSEKLAKSLGFESLAKLNELTGNPLATTKILLSHYRRVRTLAKYTIKGNAKFPDEDRQHRLEA